jgi:hypothetical protein
VLTIALAAALARLPFVATDPTHDEAGFLIVGQQWHSGGSSLYGDYWVDRPPLLISIFRVASQLGGLVPLRLLGCLATVLVVLGAGHTARRIGGGRAATWAALTAAALCVTPLLGGQSVNGELLSAPFVVGGLAAVLTAIEETDRRRSVVAAALAGAATVGSLLVKQNIADVAVFAGVTGLIAWRRGEVTTSRAKRLVLAAVAGAMACAGLVAWWTAVHGTSLAGVFDAMYPFRIEAGRVMAASSRSTANARLWMLVVCWVVSGGAVIMAVAAHVLISRRPRSAAVWGLVGVVFFDIASVALGGSYWNHYLIELVVPISVLAGVLVGTGHPAARTTISAVALSAAVALGIGFAGTHATVGTRVGESIRSASQPQDTIVTTWGHADVTRASGLTSPYPFLWSLPARTLDPKLTELNALLSGPNAPTWFVTWKSVSTWGFHGGGTVTARELAANYDPVARVGGHTIYLHRGVHRPAPGLSSSALTTPSSVHPPEELR